MWVQTNECEDWNQPYGDTNTCSTAADAGTTTAAVNSLEVGWMVGNGGSNLCASEYAGDAAAIAACELQPYIFAFITQNGYASETGAGNCFAGGAGGGSQECCPSATGSEGTDCWVAASGAPFVVGQTLGSYVQPLEHPPAEMAIQVWNGSAYGYYAWYVYIDGNLIGWYPTSGTAGTTAFSGTMASSATYLQVGGEVFDSWAGSAHTNTEMGSGIYPGCGAWYAAYHRNVNYMSGTSYYSASLSYVYMNSADGDGSRAGISGYEAASSSFGGGTGYDLWTSGNTRSGNDWGTYFLYGGSNTYYCPP